MAVQVLPSHHADAGCKWVPLHLALWNRHPTVARVLLKHGADVNFKTDRDEIPLHKLPEGDGGLELAQLLLKHGADPNARDVYGQTLLHVSSQRRLESRKGINEARRRCKLA
jgi:ankyrin repeat protein